MWKARNAWSCWVVWPALQGWEGSCRSGARSCPRKRCHMQWVASSKNVIGRTPGVFSPSLVFTFIPFFVIWRYFELATMSLQPRCLGMTWMIHIKLETNNDFIRECIAFINLLTFWGRNYFFLILAHPVYKMWIIQEQNMLELWNKLHFEQEKTEIIHHV